jgi:hypothetical protein
MRVAAVKIPVSGIWNDQTLYGKIITNDGVNKRRLA